VERLADKKKFAVKAFSKNALYNSKNGKESLINEIKIMRKLNHRNLIHLENVYESDNSVYVVIEMLQGGEFCQYLQKVPIVESFRKKMQR
jgi:serine/threonine protein kinase